LNRNQFGASLSLKLLGGGSFLIPRATGDVDAGS